MGSEQAIMDAIERMEHKLDRHIDDDTRVLAELRDRISAGQAASQARHDAMVDLLKEQSNRAFGLVEGREKSAAEETREKSALRKQVIGGVLAILGSAATAGLGYWFGLPAAPEAPLIASEPTVVEEVPSGP